MDDHKPALQGLFLRKDVLSDRVSLSPLGGVAIFVGLLFMAGALLGVYGLITGVFANPIDQVAEMIYPPTPVVIPTATRMPPTAVPTARPTDLPTRLATSAPTATRTIAAKATITPTKTVVLKPQGTATLPSTWQVFPVDAGGGTIYDAPPAIRSWVISDFMGWMQYLHDHASNPQQLLAQLKTYTSGKYYQTMSDTLTKLGPDDILPAVAIDAPKLPPPEDKPTVLEFSANGLLARVVFTSAPGSWKAYSVKTHSLIDLPAQSSMLFSWSLKYDTTAKRWKVDDDTTPKITSNP